MAASSWKYLGDGEEIFISMKVIYREMYRMFVRKFGSAMELNEKLAKFYKNFYEIRKINLDFGKWTV
jgi:hypothetical protein